MTVKSRLKKIIFSVSIVIIGLCLLAYPWISEYFYENRVDSIVHSYEMESDRLGESKKGEILSAAREYNRKLAESKVLLKDPFSLEMEEEQPQDYYSLLASDGSGIMAFLDIPEIAVHLPVYHGTSEDVLERGVGHLEYSSLPVGGKNTHAVLSAHTGLNSAKLFTDLIDLKEGDLFFLHVLGDILAYQVCEVNVVEPSDTEKLTIQKGRDLVTLITCTPYGINSHRLLVTGERIPYTQQAHEEAEREKGQQPDSLWMQAYKEAVLIGLSMVLLLALIFLNVRNFSRTH